MYRYDETNEGVMVVVPWVTEQERSAFLAEWGADEATPHLLMQQDEHAEGCGITKNRGVNAAVREGADVVVVLDGDCYPCEETPDLETLMERHMVALGPTDVRMFEVVTDPPSRGTPYAELKMAMPVAASMGFWEEVGDYCAVRQLAENAAPMSHTRVPVHGRYFPLCGMNLAFRPKQWRPWCNFIDVERFDDIWMGWLWQREAYRRGFCFNLAGPMIRHARQSNVWKNLKHESKWLCENETLWREIASFTPSTYTHLSSLLPVEVDEQGGPCR